MARTIVDDFLDGLAEYAQTFIHESIDAQLNGTPEARAPGSRRATIKRPKAKKPKVEKPAKPAPRQHSEPTLYEVLGVDAKAEPEVIEAAWKAKARLYHPDRDKSASAVRKMAEINHAHDVLGNGTARRTYDANLKREAR